MFSLMVNSGFQFCERKNNKLCENKMGRDRNRDMVHYQCSTTKMGHPDCRLCLSVCVLLVRSMAGWPAFPETLRRRFKAPLHPAFCDTNSFLFLLAKRL